MVPNKMYCIFYKFQILQSRTIECLEIEGFVAASTASVVFLLKQNELSLDSEAQLVDYCISWASQQEDAR